MNGEKSVLLGLSTRTLTPLEQEVRYDALERIAILKQWQIGIAEELNDLGALLERLGTDA